MKFQNEKVYCIHNTGNNFETIFFSERNKDYFKKKIQTFIAPYAKVLYTSLQHNQFFIVIETHPKTDLTLLPKNIGIMIGSYSRGVNKEQNRLGSLFRKGTKAFEKFSDLPTRVKEKFTALRKFFNPSRIVNFKATTITFLKALDQSINSKNRRYKEAKFYEVLRHPLGFLTSGYQNLIASFPDTAPSTGST